MVINSREEKCCEERGCTKIPDELPKHILQNSG